MENITLKENAMLKVRPELIDEWDFEKNDELGLNVYEVTKGSNKKAWWTCMDCGSHYDLSIKNRTKGQNCPYCAGKRVNETNSLLNQNPLLAKEWDFSKNNKTPLEVTLHSGEKIWWECNLGHSYEAVIRDRALGNGCPICANKKVLRDFNDLFTVEPNIALLLENLEDGYVYTRQSTAKLNWKCPCCNHSVKNKSVYSVVNNGGVSCPKCSDGRSYPEKLIYNLLLDLNINFETEKIFDWLSNKRYDFYLPEKNAIIEVHGEQHYKRIDGMFNDNRTLEEEKSNDKIKMETALSNGINHYFVINASQSSLKFIKDSLINSKILDFLDVKIELDWSKYNKTALPSLVEKASLLWNEGKHNSEIANELKVSLATVIKYLKKSSEAGLCDYKADKSRVPSNKALFKKIIQMDLEGNLIREWNSIKEAGVHFGSKRGSSISSNINGRNRSAYGYTWAYADEYYEKFGGKNSVQ